MARSLSRRPAALFLAAALVAPAASAADAASGVDLAFAERFGRLALECAHREYPNKIAHVMRSDEDALPPRKLTPAFYGCYDWHSAVHGHWLLARLARRFPESALAADARAALARSLTAENVAGEVRYLEGEGRISFERPYGLAWLLQLGAELREWDDPQAREWSAALRPLEAKAAERIRDWVPKLTYPIRIGEHAQTAFAFGLILDWARIAGDEATADVVRRAALRFHAGDRDCPLAYEPGGQDFLSPCLAEADLMRRVLDPPVYAAWLGAFLPGIPIEATGAATGATPDERASRAIDWLAPAEVSDRSDPKLAHLDGLNLSRAWMLEGIVSGLPAADPRRPALERAAGAHRDAGFAAVTGEHYEGGHWLGSFAMYLLSERGLADTGARSPG